MEEAINCASEDTPEPKIMSPGEVLLNCKPPRSTILTFGHGLESPDGHFNATILGADGAGIVIQVATGIKG